MRRALLCVVFSSLLAFSRADMAASITIAPVASFPSGGAAADSLAVADLDEDGNPDVAVTNFGTGTNGNASILWGDGTGVFSAPTKWVDGVTMRGIAVADLDADGHLDVVVGDQNAGHLTILWGNGSRSPADQQALNLNAFGAADLAVADLDGDGRPDVAVNRVDADYVEVFFNDGARNFHSVSFPAGPQPNSIAIAQIDGGFGLDIIVGGFWSSTISFLLSNGIGGFSAPVTLPAGVLPSGIVVGEFTGDSHPDIAYVRRGCFENAKTTCSNDGLTVLAGDGTGTFSAFASLDTGEGPSGLAKGDLNGDGRDDLVAANSNSDDVSIFLGQPSGGLSALPRVAVDQGPGFSPGGIAIADVNRDGCPDIVTANWRSSSVSVLLVSGCAVLPPTPGYGVSGRVRYYSNQLPVDGAIVNLTGPVAGTVPLTTGALSSGYYRHYCELDTASGPCVASAPWHLEPEKHGDLGAAISTLDAVYILQSIAGTRTLTPEQQLAADTTGNGTVSVLDAVMILQLKAGLIKQFPVATACGSDWAFVPRPAQGTGVQPKAGNDQCQRGAITVQPSLSTPADGEDFDAVVFGDLTGNWQPAPPTPTPTQ